MVAQRVKNLPAVPENWIQSLGWEEPLEEEGRATQQEFKNEGSRQDFSNYFKPIEFLTHHRLCY